MKRIIMMLMLAAMLVVALTVTAAPSFAKLTTVHKAPGSGQVVPGGGGGLDTATCNSGGHCPPGHN